MEEINIKNELVLKVYINGTPDIELIPEEIMEEFILFLEYKIKSFLIIPKNV